jgi:hypothetical protein
LHYFWIFIFEFGTIIIYIAMYITLHYRIKSHYYAASPRQLEHAQTALKLMIVYPIIYVICTLPLATLRMFSMASNRNLSFGWFCFAGAVITSNGWIDVLLYTLTRRIMLFSDDPPADLSGIETFSMPFSGPAFRRFGNQTTCEFSGGSSPRQRPSLWKGRSDLESQKNHQSLVTYSSTSNLFDTYSPSTRHSFSSPKLKSEVLSIAVNTTTSYEVRSEPLVELEDMREAQSMKRGAARPESPLKLEYDVEFETKPQGWP